MSKHTQGPWAIESDHDEDIDGTVMIHGAADQPGLVPVALVYTADAFSCVDDDDRDAFAAECRANAALIAAAPELLAACQAYIAAHETKSAAEYVRAMSAATEQIRAAIAKARGDA